MSRALVSLLAEGAPCAEHVQLPQCWCFHHVSLIPKSDAKYAKYAITWLETFSSLGKKHAHQHPIQLEYHRSFTVCERQRRLISALLRKPNKWLIPRDKYHFWIDRNDVWQGDSPAINWYEMRETEDDPHYPLSIWIRFYRCRFSGK